MNFYIVLIINAIFINNFVLSQFLGICPFLGVSKKTDTALGMGFAVIFVMGIASIITYAMSLLLDILRRPIFKNNSIYFGYRRPCAACGNGYQKVQSVFI